MSENTKRSVSGWMRDRDRSVNVRKDKHGALEADIDAYNAKIRQAKAAERRTCELRRKIDLINMELKHKRDLKEVWEDRYVD